MIRLAFDISSLNHRHISGVGVYVQQLLLSLRQIEDLKVSPVWRFSRLKHHKYFKLHAGPSRPWLGGLLAGAQVLHGPDFRVEPSSRAARVVTIHDVAFLKPGMTSPEFAAKKKSELDYLLRKATPKAIAVVSEATRRDLLSYYPEVEAFTYVTHLGGDHLNFAPKREDVPHTDDKYFLFVGNLEARKNILGIIRAFERHADHASEPTRLKLIGKPGYLGDEIIKAAKLSRARNLIDLVGYCSREDLERYYRRAVALVYPSWIEGFGLPVLEAMKLNCPVITSASTSTAEVCGTEAFLIEPGDTEAIAKAMDKALNIFYSPIERESWLASAKKRADSFTWNRCARQTLEVYKNALFNGN